MGRTALTITAVPANYATDGTAITFTAWDSGNGNEFQCTGKEILLAWNTHASAAKTVTVTSQADPYGRTADITADSIVAGGIHVYPLFPMTGWADSSGMVAVDGETTDIKFGVLRLS